jgi:NAD(P)-dependent dehydrogenase (short-subunit alcohol dehydrogenase family)
MTHRYEAEDAKSPLAWANATVARWGGVDAIVNAAGINPKVRVSDDGESELDDIWRVNVKGPLRLVRAVLPHLAACGHGRVVNLGFLSEKRVGSNVGYAMTKFAMVALTHGIRREGRAAGIRATVVCPGYVATTMTLNDDEIPRHEMSQPGDIAGLVETHSCCRTMRRSPKCSCTASSSRCSKARGDGHIRSRRANRRPTRTSGTRYSG